MSKAYEQLKILNGRYKSLAEEYNKLVTEHNLLVDKHNGLMQDAHCLLRYLEDLRRSITVYVTGSVSIGISNSMEELQLPMDVVDPGKHFCKDFHNEILYFMEKIKQGTKVSQVYEEWLEHCQQVASGRNSTIVGASGEILSQVKRED